MERFFSCDWGTSSFRLRLVACPGLKIIGEEKSDHGIAKTFELWKESGKAETQRLAFYLDVIRQYIKMLERKAAHIFEKLPLIISGMASSSIGMINLPYKELPFSADGFDLVVKITEDDANFFDKVVIVSGAKTSVDVMRGEETQLAGCSVTDEESIFIFPGTHSKHILIKKNQAVDIKTYMTGEFFHLLSKKSILSVNVEEGNGLQQKENLQSFERGVIDSTQSNLLHNAFKVRTNDLFGKGSKEENYYYLSGLLIGTELQQLAGDNTNVVLVSDNSLGPFYEIAFNVLDKKRFIVKTENADEALIAGQFKILKRSVMDL